ncbi:MAG: c-type cytochrome biogenesis protein CcsB [Candidatus Omnitrophica bacterium]|nr:c-type cytochrome biogenesis protein CcsB [Candidatus Omnitrophota bacterium]
MYSILFLSALAAYFISAAAFIIFYLKLNPDFSRYGLFFCRLGFFTHSCGFALRGFNAGFIPVTNLHESVSFFALLVMAVFLVIERSVCLRIIGAFVLPLIFLMMGVSSLFDTKIIPLMPALQSYWLFFHVLSCFLAYACFTCAFFLGIMYLLQERQVKSKHLGLLFERLPDLNIMDDINYTMVLLGFFFLTAGIVTGSVWAQQAWGSWWSCDPKETWAFITWLVYAMYLHARGNPGWKGKKTAILSIIGFFSVLFTYFGVSFLLSGKHSYL